MSKGTKRASQQINSVALQNWDTTQELVGFFFTHTAKSIQSNNAKLKTAVLTLDPKQQKELQLVMEMNESMAVLSSKFTPDQILATLEFLAHGRSITYLFTKEDIERMEAACV